MMASRFQNFGEMAESGLWRHPAKVEVSKEARRFKSCSLRSISGVNRSSSGAMPDKPDILGCGEVVSHLALTHDS